MGRLAVSQYLLIEHHLILVILSYPITIYPNLLPYLNGYRCDQDKDECLERPCQNGATCEQDLETPGKYTCYCSDEFIGQHCEEVKIKTCENYPCENGATCTDDPGMQ